MCEFGVISKKRVEAFEKRLQNKNDREIKRFLKEQKKRGGQKVNDWCEQQPEMTKEEMDKLFSVFLENLRKCEDDELDLFADELHKQLDKEFEEMCDKVCDAFFKRQRARDKKEIKTFMEKLEEQVLSDVKCHIDEGTEGAFLGLIADMHIRISELRTEEFHKKLEEQNEKEFDQWYDFVFQLPHS